MNSDFLSAYVLHRRAYRETSFLVDIFTQEHGRQRVVAKGVRNNKQAKSSLLQPFLPLQIGVTGRHELKNLRHVEAMGASFKLDANYLYSAMYLNELLLRLLPADIPSDILYRAYAMSLQGLAAKDAIEPILREFELLILQQLGYGVELTHTGEYGEPVEPDALYQFSPQQGVMEQRGSYVPGKSYSGNVLLDISRAEWHSESLKAAKRLTRQALRPLLGNKPLKSRELFLQPVQESSR
ncbi:DNA repair protein RecO [Lacimicrobium alkaliphilum]|uniref:DNA repair protein RecO n=1 Tax=Lacimicrobium alkaliphilum TaxID=1526571 RepID=UPI000BFEECB0|nr:DNA repair protein RecO [Lacimicrobium alkaliphilum]